MKVGIITKTNQKGQIVIPKKFRNVLGIRANDIITKTNQKGQIVIPKKFRNVLGIRANDLLNLVVRGRGIYIYPITEVITSTKNENQTKMVSFLLISKFNIFYCPPQAGVLFCPSFILVLSGRISQNLTFLEILSILNY